MIDPKRVQELAKQHLEAAVAAEREPCSTTVGRLTWAGGEFLALLDQEIREQEASKPPASTQVGALVAFVKYHGGLPKGKILGARDHFHSEVEDGGDFLEDHDFSFTEPPSDGLQIFEGTVEHTVGDDPDVYLAGTWRRLTDSELHRFVQGKMPWE